MKNVTKTIKPQSPTLNTILMVEDTLKKAKGGVISIADLKRKLPKQINHTTLKTILSYLEESNKIAVSVKGITWVPLPSAKMRLALARSFVYPEDFPLS